MNRLKMKIALELAKIASEIMAGRPRMTKEEFIQRAREMHGDRYDYSRVNMDKRDEKGRVLIKCRKCGTEFWQRPDKHLDGNGCMNCYIEESGVVPGESNIDLPAEEQIADGYTSDNVAPPPMPPAKSATPVNTPPKQPQDLHQPYRGAGRK